MITLVGTTGSWRVRAHAEFRQGAMRAVWPRTTGSDPNPIDWPAGDASLQRVSGNDISPQDPYAALRPCAARSTCRPAAGAAVCRSAAGLWTRGGIAERQGADRPGPGTLGPLTDFERHDPGFSDPRQRFGIRQRKLAGDARLYGIRFD